ncbi:MAG: peptidoglycan DD-metalloendopeptidase family protein [Acidimicrobiia bacterium]|nr:peptidoglycan DD-metalloendopeptidase family protein [Acidimicrobiia bacterium]
MFPSRLTTILLVVALALALALPVGAAPRAEVSVDEASAAAEAARAELNAGAERVADAQAVYYELENEVMALESDIEAAEAYADELRAVARDRAADAYTGGNVDFAEALGSDNVLDVARKTQLLEQLKADDDQKVEELGALEEDLDRQRAELDAKKEDQAAALEKMESEIADLEEKAAAAESVLAEAREQARIEAERAAAAEAARAAEAAARASRDAAAAAAAQQAAPAPAAPAPSGPVGNLGGSPGGPGNIICPFPGHAGFSDSWGDPRSGGRSHQGVDMGGPYGGALVAVVSGNVSFGDMGGGGMGATLSGSDGNVYLYMHMSGYGKGGAVQQGDVIGYNGATGNGTPGFNHLHFEVHPGGGGATNPYPWVAPVC